ncbi:MAG: tRNA preQ1(34) S-adenosylmethionine ribosyltransferase-isomerase QueA [Verrucomicrobia bacterium]|nr:tRNA preQ1(34) S-adenosylmethionine ribosyltransferase-isomerase QueA [Verrucomicrobiota bacterium]
MQTRDFDFDLPPELVAQAPTAQRGDSRLLVLDRSTGHFRHCQFRQVVDCLCPGDLLVLNDSRVIRARLRAAKDSGSEIEILLLEENQPNEWWVLLRPGKRVRAGTRLMLYDLCGKRTSVAGCVQAKDLEGLYLVRFQGSTDIADDLDWLGEIPLPPYITRRPQIHPVSDYDRYQTVYADRPGSVAAPTAGLHFTEELLQQIRDRGVRIQCVTLHVGLGTFGPVKTEWIKDHVMHEERFELTLEAAEAINQTRKSGNRIFAVGTTAVRVLETVAAANQGIMRPASGRTGIFIAPPCRFQAVDALITNFHLPKSTLLMLASAFAAPGETRGRVLILSAYAEAIRERYRFFSYGDAMLIL